MVHADTPVSSVLQAEPKLMLILCRTPSVCNIGFSFHVHAEIMVIKLSWLFLSDLSYIVKDIGKQFILSYIPHS